MGLAVDQLGQARIGLHRDQAGPVLAQPAHVLGHFLRAGGAVQAHERHVQRVDDRGRRRDVGTDEQRAGRLDRDLHENGGIRAHLGAGDLGAVDGGLDLERVLAGLDQQAVHAAFNQATALFGQARLERVIVDIAQRGQLGARPDGADHVAVPPVGKTFRRFARQMGGGAVDLTRAVGQPELTQRDGRAAKAVGFHHVRPGLEIATVDLAHQFGAGEVQDLGAVFLPPVIAFNLQIQKLHA